MPAIPYSPNVIVSTDGALRAGAVKNSFFRSLVNRQEKMQPYIDTLFATARRSEGIEELHAQVAPNTIWRRWPKGQPRVMDAGKEFYYTIVNHEYNAGMHLHKNDRMDDRTGTFQLMVADAAKSYYSLFIDIMHQMLTGTANPDYLPSIPNSYYGISLISAAHTFATGGNTFAGGGTTSALIEADIFNAINLFLEMTQEGRHYKFWSADEARVENLVFVIPPELHQVFETLQKGNLIQGTQAGISNIVQNRFNYYVEPRLTDADDWYAILNADPAIKPFVRQPRDEIVVSQEIWPADSYSKQTGYEYYAASARWGFSVYEPRSIIKVTN